MCHILLALPLLGLGVFWIWPIGIAAPVYGGITALSLVLYVLVWNAMRREPWTGLEALLQSSGEVVDCDGSLRIRIRGETWNASSAEQLERGARVRVIGVDGLELRVQRVASAHK